MFQDVLNQVNSTIQSNPLLVAGIGSVGFGSVLYSLKTVPKSIWSQIKHTFTTRFTVHTRHDQFTNIQTFLDVHSSQFFTRSFSLPFYKKTLIPGYGTSFGIYKKTLFSFNKKQLESKNEIEEELTISFLTRNKSVVEAFVADAVAKKKKDATDVYFQLGSYFDGVYERPKRNFETIYIEDDNKEALISALDRFISQKEYYLSRGIPYKFALLLEGPPGTGKTSLIRAIADKYDRCIRFINNISNVDTLCSELNENDIIVLEDVDAMSSIKNREDEVQEADAPASPSFDFGNSKLSALLNSIDGFRTPTGTIWILTTNYVERLDPALIRPGRMDLKLNIAELSFKTMCRMYKDFYGTTCKMKETDYKPKVGSVLQEIFVRFDSKDAIEELKK